MMSDTEPEQETQDKTASNDGLISRLKRLVTRT